MNSQKKNHIGCLNVHIMHILTGVSYSRSGATVKKSPPPHFRHNSYYSGCNSFLKVPGNKRKRFISESTPPKQTKTTNRYLEDDSFRDLFSHTFVSTSLLLPENKFIQGKSTSRITPTSSHSIVEMIALKIYFTGVDKENIQIYMAAYFNIYSSLDHI